MKLDGFEGKWLHGIRWRRIRPGSALKFAIGALSLALLVAMFLAFRAPTLEEFVVSRLEKNGVSAGIAEDGFDEATISATRGGRKFFILVRSPQFVSKGAVQQTQTFGQITAKLVATAGVRGDVWRFHCKLKVSDANS